MGSDAPIPDRTVPVVPAPPRRAAALAVGLGGLCLAALAFAAFGASAGLGLSLALYLAASGIVVAGAAGASGAGASGAEPGGFGLANAITLVRVVLVALMAGGLARGEAAHWPAAAAFLVLALDGIDGWWARRSGTASAFGARFDMETDALYVLVMALLLWIGDRYDSWLLVAGLARYCFVAAGAVWPDLTRPLPPRGNRRVAFVAMAAAMSAALSPLVPGAVADPAIVAAFVFLVWSFAVDVVLLFRAGAAARIAEEKRP